MDQGQIMQLMSKLENIEKLLLIIAAKTAFDEEYIRELSQEWLDEMVVRILKK